MLKRLFLLLLVLSLFFPTKVEAIGLGCSVTVSPTQIRSGRTSTVEMNFANTGDVPIKWIHFYSGDTNLTPISNQSVSSGWQMLPGDNATGDLAAGSSMKVYVVVNAVASLGTSNGWSGQAASLADGSDAITCDGSFGVDLTDTAPSSPIISGISLGVGATKTTISWTTLDPSNSVVNYGLSSGALTMQKNAADMVTNHELLLDALTTETTYYYQITSIGSGGLSSQSEVNSFTTGKTNTVTNTVTETVTNTVTTTVTQVKEVKIKDQTPPVVVLNKFEKGNVFEEAPMISGSITDDMSISHIEYSLDGQNWVKMLVGDKVGQKSGAFKILPSVVDDGNYRFYVRGYDSTGNRSGIKFVDFVIDRYPPVVGPGIVSSGPLIFYPSATGVLDLAVDQEYTVVVPESGGSTEVVLVINGKRINLVKDLTTDFWRGKISFQNQFEGDVNVEAVDGAKNKTKRLWLKVRVRELPQILDGQKNAVGSVINVFEYDVDARSFKKRNEMRYVVAADGKYYLPLPRGEYYLTVDLDGKRGLISNIFRIDKTGILFGGINFNSKENNFFDKLLGLFGKRKEINILGISEDSVDEGLVGISWLGKSVGLEGEKMTTWMGVLNWIQIGNTSLADTSFQYLQNKSWMDRGGGFRFVGLQESMFKVASFIKKGGYNISPLADPQASLLEKIPMWTLPVNVFLDRSGKIVKIKQGLVNQNDLIFE